MGEFHNLMAESFIRKREKEKELLDSTKGFLDKSKEWKAAHARAEHVYEYLQKNEPDRLDSVAWHSWYVQYETVKLILGRNKP